MTAYNNRPSTDSQPAFSRLLQNDWRESLNIKKNEQWGAPAMTCKYKL